MLKIARVVIVMLLQQKNVTRISVPQQARLTSFKPPFILIWMHAQFFETADDDGIIVVLCTHSFMLQVN
jgi:hypothetical protein